MRKLTLVCAVLLAVLLPSQAQSVRERILMDEDWQFAFGNASSPEKDFGCGTEYFNYLTKAASIHNEGPYSPKFDASKWSATWKNVNLPHDWVVDLPYAREASHSHGYKTVGYKYPETSVGWYRKTFTVPHEDLGKHLYLQFDGIFRDARVWVNGFYLGHEPSGYATQTYDITEYLNYGEDNLITVRADATLEEGWFYEGAGIYRHVWLNKTAPVHVAPFGTFVHSPFLLEEAVVFIETTVENSGLQVADYSLRHVLLDQEGRELLRKDVLGEMLQPKSSHCSKTTLSFGATDQGMEGHPKGWWPDNPYLYKMRTEVYQDNKLVDEYITRFGMRSAMFDKNGGFFLNGRRLKLKGVNMHQDHAGVGAGIPDALQFYRLKQLKAFGCNAYRSSHNPMTPEMLDACDSLGILVIEENRLPGVNEEHIRLLKRMIDRDRNHPSIILWSVGNEEWGIEWKESGTRIAATMREYCHRFDPTRSMTVASSSGPAILIPADVAGYNYILQNPVEQHRKDYPQRSALGSEETTGSGTRGIYFDVHDKGRMVALNRKHNGPDSLLNCIERGWKFYDERPYLAGIFYWTGFDYRGERNPMKFPATGSQFGILDYCGFPKDEAWYLKSWWTDEPVLHILPHWNLQGHEGENIDIWVYSNCDEVELTVNGKNLGRKSMPKNGHLSWTAVYQPGAVKATGYTGGKKILTRSMETTGVPALISLTADRSVIRADNRDVAVCRVEFQDKKKRFVPTACNDLTITVSGPVRILGVGNGDPAYQTTERPVDTNTRTYQVKAFNGLAQILLQSTGEVGEATLTVGTGSLPGASLVIRLKER
ncbi:beta-galactosidase GalA [uncultured Bacteroides sp.]|uniref:beta-galactosidase GalA n=1 Tax=uncultured Bacteroides sp. TaxID=162156 RepID=UPI00280AC5D6|nr:beta-galactosidase GalA [uncultured Bacteroides sp.]